jgi:hypothetical protein
VINSNRNAGEFENNHGAAGKISKGELDKEKEATTTKRKNHNNIKAIGNPKTLKYLNLDLDSPMMRDSMNQLGLEDEDLDYKKCLEDFKPKKGEPA